MTSAHALGHFLRTLPLSAAATFLALFPIVDPFGGIPIFFTMTASWTAQDRRRTAYKTGLWVFAILVTFLLIGIWHGVGWNYAAFGLAQALGVVTVHYYTLFLKKRLGRDGFKAYNQNRWIRAAGVVITFSYYAATLFLFANTFSQMRAIFSLLR